jgi:hypothetical protein
MPRAAVSFKLFDAALPPHWPGLLGCVGRHLVSVYHPWAHHGRAAAVARTLWKPSSGVWHQKHRATGEMPHTSIDTEAGWSKSGWHGWWYGGTRHLAVSVETVWIPLAAALTPANTADNGVVPRLVAPLPAEVHSVLGDTAYNAPEGRRLCERVFKNLHRRAPRGRRDEESVVQLGGVLCRLRGY